MGSLGFYALSEVYSFTMRLRVFLLQVLQPCMLIVSGLNIRVMSLQLQPFMSASGGVLLLQTNVCVQMWTTICVLFLCYDQLFDPLVC